MVRYMHVANRNLLIPRSTHVYRCGMAAFALLAWPWYLRDLVAYVHPAVRRLARDHQEMREIIEPILHERQQQQQQGAGKPAKRPVDMLAAVLGHHAATAEAASLNPKPLNVGLVAEDMLSLGILASNTTASLVCAKPRHSSIHMQNFCTPFSA